MSRFKLLPLTGLLAIGLSVAGGAHAAAYALSSDNIQRFTIGITGAIQFGPSTDTTSTSATLNGNITAPPTVPGASDAPVAVAPLSTPLGSPQFSNNGAFPGVFNLPLGKVGTYSYADALITHPGGGIFDARNIAESYVAGNGSASGTATNSSATGFVSSFTVGLGGGSLDFSFLADPLIQVFLSAGSLSGSFAQGTLSASLTITCADAQACGNNPFGTIAYNWAPNGVTSGITGVTGTVGGNELADPENLNLTLTQQFPPGPGFQDHSLAAVLSPYRATTNSFGAGTYSLSLAMTETDAVLSKVPEPGTTALVALGLVGLGLATRRRRQV